MKLNLVAKNTSQQAIKDYLENNASQILADKINNGVQIEKDGKTLLNKKDLDGFWNYASKKARELKHDYEDNDTVFGWAIHYFEENELIGSLFELKTNEKFNGKRAKEYFFRNLSAEEKTKVIKENPNIMIPGVKFSSLYVSPGIFIC